MRVCGGGGGGEKAAKVEEQEEVGERVSGVGELGNDFGGRDDAFVCFGDKEGKGFVGGGFEFGGGSGLDVLGGYTKKEEGENVGGYCVDKSVVADEIECGISVLEDDVSFEGIAWFRKHHVKLSE